MVSFFGSKNKEAPYDPRKITKTLKSEQIEKRNFLHSLKKRTDDTKITEFLCDTDVFYKQMDPHGRFGVMPLNARVGKRIVGTNIVLDPINRMPPLGDTMMTQISDQVISSDDEDSIEESRAPNIRSQFTAKDQKIGTFLGDSLSFTDTGRTLINGAEYIKLVDESNLNNAILICVPWCNITPDQEHDILQQLLHDTNLNTSKNGGNFKNIVLAILGVHSLDKSRWSEGIIILTSSPEKVALSVVESEAWENSAKTALQANVYKTPILVDASVVNAVWSNKVIKVLPTPIPSVGKRSALETTIFETSDEKRQEISIESIETQIEKLNNILRQFQYETDVNKRSSLLTKHEELTISLQKSCEMAERASQLTINQLNSEIAAYNIKLNQQKSEKQALEQSIAEAEDSYTKMMSEKQLKIKNLENKMKSLQQNETSQLDAMQQEKTDLYGQINAQKDQIEKLKLNLDRLVAENLQLNDKLSEATNALNDAVDSKSAIKYKNIKISNSAKKLKTINQYRNKTSKLTPQKMSFSDHSDSEEENETTTLLTPKDLMKSANRSKVNSISVSLNPRKAGLSSFTNTDQTFGQWWQQNLVQIEFLESEIGTANTLRMILMNLPNSLQWISQSLSSDVANNLHLAKKAIMELLYGKSGNISNFLNITKGVTEHPIAFLVRMKNELDAASADTENTFVLQAISEKLIKNVDQNLAIELKRQLKDVSKYENIVNGLKSALQLTTLSGTLPTSLPEAFAQTMSFDSSHVVDAINRNNKWQKQKKPNFSNRSYRSNQNNNGYQSKLGNRETKKKGSIKCWTCGGNHMQRDCKNRKNSNQQNRNSQGNKNYKNSNRSYQNQ